MSTTETTQEKSVIICQHCRRRVRKQKNAWYHQGSGSIFCDPTGGVDGHATPIRIEQETGDER